MTTTNYPPKWGCTPNVTCSLKLREKSKPIFLKERQVPYALQEAVEEELDNLERDNIITRVDTSDWGSPLVVIPKPDGTVRLCVDYKIAVNPQLTSAHYPIRRIDDILNNLKDSAYFCRLDLFKAYLHVKVDEESRAIQTISTHRGTYQMNRLSFGIKTAPSEFNRILEQILQGLEGTLSYFDDIIIHGSSLEDCKKRLINCLERLKTYNIHINREKCDFFKKEIQYLGYIVSHNQISKCPKKVEAITVFKTLNTLYPCFCSSSLIEPPENPTTPTILNVSQPKCADSKLFDLIKNNIEVIFLPSGWNIHKHEQHIVFMKLNNAVLPQRLKDL